MAKPRITYEITAEDKSKKAVSDIERRLARAARVGVAAIATSAAAGAAGLLVLAKNAAVAADNIGKLSTQLGIGAKELSEYQFVAEQTGVRFDTFTMALQRSTRRIAEAAQGTGEAKDAIAQLGLSAQRLSELDPGAQFEVIAKQLAQVTNEGEQVRLAFKLFDSEGVRLLRTIKQTGGEFDALRERSRELGATIDKDLTNKAADVNDSWNEVKTALAGVGNSLLSTFGPAIVATANNLVEFINKTRRAAEAIGLLDTRISQLKIKELNELWIENNREIVKQEKVIRNLHEASQGPARARIAELEAQNEKIKEQLGLLGPQKTIDAGTSAAQEGAVVGAVGGQGAENTEKQYQAYLESLLSEEEALRLSYERRLQLIEDNTAAGSELRTSLQQQEHARLESDLLKHQAKLGKIEAKGIIARRKFEEASYKQKTKTVIGHVLKLTDGVAQSNKTLFKINKIAAIANATIDAFRGISLPLASYPYPFNIGMAALHGAAAFAQISAIKNTSFSGGGGGTTPSLAGTSPVINDIPVSAPVSDEQLTTGASTSNVVTISFAPGISDTETVRKFIEEDLSEALRDGAGPDVRVVAQ